MPNLQIPQRQTFPAIRGSVSDQDGLLPLASAQQISLLLSGPGGSPLASLPVVVIEPPEQFLLNGVSIMANWEAPLAGATAIVASTMLYQAKLKIIWQSVPDLLQQFCPQVGFVTIEIVDNLNEAP